MIAARRGDKSESFAQQAAKVLNLDLADANPVSIITQKVSSSRASSTIRQALPHEVL